jgi:putative transposase
VTLRGNHQEPIFTLGSDRTLFNSVLSDAIDRFSARIHAFCWMTNHIHILIQIGDTPLGKVMQRVAVRYSRHKQKALGTSGHLFERRYHARFISSNSYFLAVLRYIHLNPQQAGLVIEPSDFEWSSHRAYLGIESIAWLTTDFGLSLFHAKRSEARRAYQRFMLKQHAGELAPEKGASGDPSFSDRAPALVDDDLASATLRKLAVEICEQHGVPLELLLSRSSQRILTPVRVDIVEQATQRGIASVVEVARFLRKDASTLYKLAAKQHRKVYGS